MPNFLINCERLTRKYMLFCSFFEKKSVPSLVLVGIGGGGGNKVDIGTVKNISNKGTITVVAALSMAPSKDPNGTTYTETTSKRVH